jgi:hypothetical protein
MELGAPLRIEMMKFPWHEAFAKKWIDKINYLIYI